MIFIINLISPNQHTEYPPNKQEIIPTSFLKKDTYILLDSDGNQINENVYKDIYEIYPNRYKIKQKDWGVIDNKGNYILKPNFSKIYTCASNKYCAKKCEIESSGSEKCKSYIIDKNGKIKKEGINFKAAYNTYPFKQSNFIYSYNKIPTKFKESMGKVDVYNDDLKKILSFETSQDIAETSRNLIESKYISIKDKDGKLRIINLKGKDIISPVYSKKYRHFIKDNKIYFVVSKDDDYKREVISEDNKVSTYNKDEIEGKKYIPHYSDEYYIKQGKGYFLSNTRREYLYNKNKKLLFSADKPGSYIKDCDYYFLLVKYPSKDKIFDKKLKKITYEGYHIRYIADNIFRAYDEEKDLKLITADGKPVINSEYTNLKHLKLTYNINNRMEDLYLIKNKDKTGLINHKGEIILPIEYQDIILYDDEFHNYKFFAKKDNKWMHVDKNNKIIAKTNTSLTPKIILKDGSAFVVNPISY